MFRPPSTRFALVLVSGLGLTATPSAASATASRAAQDTALELSSPRVVLTEVPFDISFTAPRSPDSVAYRVVRVRDGRVLADGIAAAGSEVNVRNLTIDRPGDLPLQIEAGNTIARVRPLALPGWLSLLPPLIAIALALIFREVVVSLFAGVWIGALLVAGLDPLAATLRSIDRFVMPALADPDHASIVIFSLLLGGMVGLMGRSGGTQGIVDAVSPLATTRRRGQLATYLSGLGIFFDDYANTLIVGNTLRPITDRLRISREKLAYLVDATAAPVSAIVIVSTWVGFEISLIADGLNLAAQQVAGTDPALAANLHAASPLNVFLYSIPYRFYPLLALLLVFLVAMTGRDFGPMLAAERRAARGGGLHRPDAMLLTDTSAEVMEPKPGTPHRWINALAPVATVVLVVLLGLYLGGRASLGRSGTLSEYLGAANSFNALLWGSLAGCLVAGLLAVGQRILALQEAIDAWLGGLRAMVLAMVILVLAWSLGAVTQAVGTAQYVSHLLQTAGFPEGLLPVAVFAAAAVISFATGTSWGTMAILVPLVIPLAVGLGGGVNFESGTHYTILLGTVSSVLAGAIFGDHCSPISDTTVMSSMASACDHVDHVRTQLPYALLVAVVGMMVGDVPTAFGLPWPVSYLLGVAILFLVLRTFGAQAEVAVDAVPELRVRPQPAVEED